MEEEVKKELDELKNKIESLENEIDNLKNHRHDSDGVATGNY
jgi:cell division protein FtsB